MKFLTLSSSKREREREREREGEREGGVKTIQLQKHQF